MCCWYWSEPGTLWGWWWLIPLAGIVLCFVMFRFFRRRRADVPFCGWEGVHRTEVDALKEEIRGLRDELAKMKGKQGG